MTSSTEALKPANDTVADELAAIIKTSKIGTDKCAGMMTRELSNGERYFIQTKSAAEAEAKMRRDKLATAGALKHKLWMVASHATGGELGRLSMDEVCAMSANQISVRITAFRNVLWEDAKKSARAPTHTSQDRIAGDAISRAAAVAAMLNATENCNEYERVVAALNALPVEDMQAENEHP